MAARDGRILDHEHAVGARVDLAELRVGRERAAAHDEVEHPLPLRVAEVCIGMAGHDFGTQRLGGDAAGQRERDDVLGQHVQTLPQRPARLDAPGFERGTRGGELSEFERMRRHADDAAGGAGLMARAAGALQQPRDTLRPADLDHLIDRAEVDTEVERAGRDHAAQRTAAQAGLGGRAQLGLDRAVMQRHGQAGTDHLERLEPAFGLRARVGEQQCRARGIDRLGDARQQLQAHVTSPREAVDGLGDQRVDDDALRLLATDQPAASAGTDERRERFLEIAERGRQAPDAQAGPPRPVQGRGFGLT